MRATELEGLETTLQKTHEWVNEISTAIGEEDAHQAFGGLRAVLHALRDRLTVNEAAQLGAQLPMLIRGLYYEGWSPKGKPLKMHKADFLDAIRHQFPRPDRLHPEVVARAVLAVVARHVTPGEIRDIVASLPADLRDLWPGHGADQPG